LSKYFRLYQFFHQKNDLLFASCHYIDNATPRYKGKSMKLATFVRAQNRPEIGVVIDDTVYPAPTDLRIGGMNELIANWNELSSSVAKWPALQTGIPLSSVRLLAPVPCPEKILAIGLNYAAHVKEGGPRDLPTSQIWFSKQRNSVNGPYDPIQMPRVSTMIDYEVELVVIIGKRCKHVSPSDAADVIFGYCVGNDVSVRDWQRRTPQWTLGKSFDTHGPFGPWITTTDEVADPHALDISCKVNGELRQSSNTQHMLFNIFDQIAELSKAMTLEPGDVIFTGTPSGVGVAMKPPQFLQPGDRVTCEIAVLGRIEGVLTPE
jgi:2-keto-4-pentenoate hydratase/2-oxohepta-3-ene-1,7-dioic acid hydratase in catechol pathway